MASATPRSLVELLGPARLAAKPTTWTVDYLRLVGINFEDVDHVDDVSGKLTPKSKSHGDVKLAKKLTKKAPPSSKRAAFTELVSSPGMPFSHFCDSPPLHFAGTVVHQPNYSLYRIMEPASHGPWLGYFHHAREVPLHELSRWAIYDHFPAVTTLPKQGDDWTRHPYFVCILLSMAQVQRDYMKPTEQELYTCHLFVTDDNDAEFLHLFKVDMPSKFLHMIDRPGLARMSSPAVHHDGVEQPSTNTSDTAALLHKTKTRLLLLFDELPEWAKDNEFILSGWRPETNSQWECIKSMCYIHNETGNIYTHLLAAVWMVVLGLWWSVRAKELYPTANSDDAIVFFLFFLGGTVCYLLSTTYHVMSNHSHATHFFCLKLDFLGILVVTAGCFPPGLWYTFPCASRQVKFTWIAIDLTAQFIAAILVLFVKSFQAHKMRPLRGFVFSVMASSAFYPIAIKIMQVGWSRAATEYGASLYALTLLIYLCSVIIYALRVPEAWKPGFFDIWCQSHQIFHVGMAIGLTVHFMAFVRALDQFYVIKQGQCPDL
ncbi:HlyIII-domain-containing protein [Paramyrothecium foliicola]|nr:HlyIII-domain-containing protein [Paramyrothecium foliicola]